MSHNAKELLTTQGQRSLLWDTLIQGQLYQVGTREKEEEEEEEEMRERREGREEGGDERGGGRAGKKRRREGREEEEGGEGGGGGRAERRRGGDQQLQATVWTSDLLSLLQVVRVVEVFNASLQRKFLLLEIPRFGIQVVPVGPVVMEMMANSPVDG